MEQVQSDSGVTMPDEIIAILNDQSRSLGRLESAMQELLGNGKPGLIKEMRDDIDSLKESRSHMRGYVAGLGGALAVLEFVYHYLMHKLGFK